MQAHPANFKDITGQRFGRLTATEYVGRYKNGRQALWRCQCDCGNEVFVPGRSLRAGMTKSCGCFQRESRYDKSKAYRKHGMAKTRIYSIWNSMRDRCNNPNCSGYEHYGARGIKVCDEWNKDFCLFYVWAINNGYTDSLTIDRMDVNGDYTPTNCRFVDMSVQQFNKRKPKSKLGIRGVAYNEQTKKYIATIYKNKKQIFLGSFTNLNDAVMARHEAEKKYYGMVLDA